MPLDPAREIQSRAQYLPVLSPKPPSSGGATVYTENALICLAIGLLSFHKMTEAEVTNVGIHGNPCVSGQKVDFQRTLLANVWRG